jgi:hypothetical protein
MYELEEEVPEGADRNEGNKYVYVPKIGHCKILEDDYCGETGERK